MFISNVFSDKIIELCKMHIEIRGTQTVVTNMTSREMSD